MRAHTLGWVRRTGAPSEHDRRSGPARAEPDRRLRDARVGAVFAVLAATVTGGTAGVLPGRATDPATVAVVTAAVALAAAILVQLPWRRAPRWALAGFPLLVLLDLAGIAVAAPGVGAAYGGLVAFCFAYTGMVATAAEVVLLAAPAVGTWALLFDVPADGLPGQLAVRLTLSVALWLTVGLLAAQRSGSRHPDLARPAPAAALDAATGLLTGPAVADALDRVRPGDVVVVVHLDQPADDPADDHPAGGPPGPVAADRSAAAFGTAVRESLRGGDLGARRGSTDFLLLLCELEPADAEIVLERVLSRWRDRCGPVSFCAGTAVRSSGEAAELSVDRATAACRRARSGGRGRWLTDAAPATAPRHRTQLSAAGVPGPGHVEF